MRFSWDPGKNDGNYRDRGFDFAFASLIFEGAALAAGLELTVCYTDRVLPGGEIDRRIISARRSNRRERKAYEQAIAGR